MTFPPRNLRENFKLGAVPDAAESNSEPCLTKQAMKPLGQSIRAVLIVLSGRLCFDNRNVILIVHRLCNLFPLVRAFLEVHCILRVSACALCRYHSCAACVCNVPLPSSWCCPRNASYCAVKYSWFSIWCLYSPEELLLQALIKSEVFYKLLIFHRTNVYLSLPENLLVVYCDRSW